tara:strand:+ start:215 stop:331 length:117 start_codon:yes stop_codon:yes gene_type:complete
MGLIEMKRMANEKSKILVGAEDYFPLFGSKNFKEIKWQ